jgi:hypothetical protein
MKSAPELARMRKLLKQVLGDAGQLEHVRIRKSRYDEEPSFVIHGQRQSLVAGCHYMVLAPVPEAALQALERRAIEVRTERGIGLGWPEGSLVYILVPVDQEALPPGRKRARLPNERRLELDAARA